MVPIKYEVRKMGNNRRADETWGAKRATNKACK